MFKKVYRNLEKFQRIIWCSREFSNSQKILTRVYKSLEEFIEIYIEKCKEVDNGLKNIIDVQKSLQKFRKL